MTTVTALYPTANAASRAIADLKETGVSGKNISILSTDIDDKLAAEVDEAIPADDTLKGLLSGGVWGGALGFLAGLTALAIPGVGPILAAGPIAAAIGGAEIGAVAGGLVGAIKDLGVDEDRADFYAEHVQSGETLVIVDVDSGLANHVEEVLNRHRPIEFA